MTASNKDIQYRGFNIDGGFTVYLTYPSEIPFNIYFGNHNSMDAAKKTIDYLVESRTKYPIRPKPLNLCHEVSLCPEIHYQDGSVERLIKDKKRKMDMFEYNICKDSNILPILLSYESDKKVLFDKSENLEYTHAIVNMLYSVYTYTN